MSQTTQKVRRILRRVSHLEQERSGWEAHWRDCRMLQRMHRDGLEALPARRAHH